MGSRPLEEVPDGISIFVDTNILIYHLLEDELYGASCCDFLKRIEAGAVSAEATINHTPKNRVIVNVDTDVTVIDNGADLPPFQHLETRRPQGRPKIDAHDQKG